MTAAIRRAAAIVAFGALLGVGEMRTVLADGVQELCAHRGGSEAVCACTAHRLAGETGIDEYALLHRVAWDSLRLGERGADPSSAWEGALEAEIERARNRGDGAGDGVIRRRIAGLARAHRAFMQHCAASHR